MLTSGIAVGGEGIHWSGNLEKDIHQVKRVVYCKACRGPIDFHALLRGHLDARLYPAAGGWIAFFAAVLSFMANGLDFWPSVGVSLLPGIAVAMMLRSLERRRLKRWRLEEQGPEG